jgi:hypothetical protein
MEAAAAESLTKHQAKLATSAGSNDRLPREIAVEAGV